jgi:hypothetical protein
MTNNVIKFPNKKLETIENKQELTLNQESIEFAYEIADVLHDVLHERTGDCIFTDDDYTPLVICVTEVISAIYMMSQGHDHPFQEIAQELFGNVDIDAEMDYDESNELDEDK